MNKEKWLQSLYSDTSENFVSNPYPKKGEKISISIRFLKNDSVRHVILRSRELGVEHLYEMKKDYEEKNLCYYSVEVQIFDSYFNYHFYLVTEKGIYYYSQYQISDYIPSEEHDFVILCDYDAPKWVKESVFYQIFPDRFCNGRPDLNVKDGEYSYQGFFTSEEKWESAPKKYSQGHNLDFHNGDLYGIIQKLDYLEELGISAIYLNPIFLSPSTHKYDALDYFIIDPHLGGEKAFSELIKEAHKRGIKILLDISINHTSSSAKWFKEAYNDKNSPYREFYFFNDDNSYASWFGIQTMPQLNYSSQKLRNTIYREKDSVLKKWMLPPFGIDGWRFDVADCLARNERIDLHDQVLKEIRQELKSVKKDAYLLAEEWADCSVDLKGDKWDATMNYFGVGRQLREFAGAKDLYLERNDILREVDFPLTAPQLSARIKQFLTIVPGSIQLQQFNLVDSHDVVRLHNIKSVSEDALKAAIVLQFTLPGSPCIYYGDEIFLDGGDDRKEDSGFRYPFDWEWQKKEKAQKTRSFYKKIIKLRRTEKSLINGSFDVVFADGFTIITARFTRREVIFTLASMEKNDRNVVLPLENFGVKAVLHTKDLLGSELTSSLCEDGKNLQVLLSAGKTYLLKFSAD